MVTCIYAFQFHSSKLVMLLMICAKHYIFPMVQGIFALIAKT